MKRVTLFCGHYGSGKTNLAVNYALKKAREGFPVVIGDLDIVNPYYRTKDSTEELTRAGIEVVSLPYANTNVDLPSIPSAMYGLVQDRSRYAILDIGGDDRGAYALGRFRSYILEENDFDSLFAVNFCRPLTPDAESALEIMREVEAAAGLPFTALVNNTNLGAETTPEIVLKSAAKAEALSRLTGLPVIMTGIGESLLPALKGRIPDLLPMRLQKRPTE